LSYDIPNIVVYELEKGKKKLIGFGETYDEIIKQDPNGLKSLSDKLEFRKLFFSQVDDQLFEEMF